MTATLVTGVVRGCEDPPPDASSVTVAADRPLAAGEPAAKTPVTGATADAEEAEHGSTAGRGGSNDIDLPPLTTRTAGTPPTPAVRTPAPEPAPAARKRTPDRGKGLALPPSPAKKLSVPAITIESPVMELGLDRHGRLTAPPVDNPRIVGWYRDGPSPGERGTSLLVGHRDTKTGPAIFLNLNALKPGDKVDVVRADRRTAVFTVDKVRTYKKDQFPDAEVYGHTGRPELRLLTCGGSFDEKTGYAANVVVFAHLTDVRRV
ncbi:class F sortase [Streptomyces peucetius]|uniref:Class F sortase n=1 Tax=Streptomyces peucetius TaxID=1950 RepID=A0ABY6I2S9_STRPE|nr:class F sortase [Streptomyces peucetius]UYQ61288.1 class F sortase [Streptomyces peucetius]